MSNNINLDHFKIRRITKLEDLESGKVKILPESDLTIQTDTSIIQFDHIDEEDSNRKVIVKPGCYTIETTTHGTVLEKLSLREYNLLKTIDNTSLILKEADTFFNKVEVYKKLKREPKRAILLCSDPGVGKTASINEVCKKFLKEEGTAVVVWDTSSVRSQIVNRFFINQTKFSKKTKKLILVIEDIDGGSVDEYSGGIRSAESALLNLLDGVGSPFKGIPTFIIATTNNPETSVKALIDRPGRFDKVVELNTPNKKECSELLCFIKNEKLTEDDIKASELAAENKFSIAHIQETVVRAQLDDISILEATQQLVKHKKRFKDAFKKETKSIGFS